MAPQFYNTNAIELSKQYLSKLFEQVHQSSLQFLPSTIATPNARILDLGASYAISTKYFTTPLATTPINQIENNQQKRFFAEANIALPILNLDNVSIDDLFEALVMQRGRLKEMQQLREW